MKFRDWSKKREIDEAMGFVQKLPYQKAVKRPPVKKVSSGSLTMSVNTKPDFEKALKMFMKGAQKKVDDDIRKNSYPFKKELKISKGGKRYLRVYSHMSINGETTSQSAFCFIDKTNGDVLKPAGWKAPAKGVRSNIFDGSWGVNGVTAHGAVYLR